MLQLLKNWIRSDRHEKIASVVDIPAQGRVLDISCGDGELFERLHAVRPGAAFFGIDVSAETIEEAKKRVPFAQFSVANAEKTNFQKGFFDVVISAMALHHYERADKVFAEISRVLRPSGVAYVVDLIPKGAIMQKFWNWRGCHEPYHFEKYYLVKDLERTLKSLDLTIIEDRRIATIQRIRILKLRKG